MKLKKAFVSLLVVGFIVCIYGLLLKDYKDASVRYDIAVTIVKDGEGQSNDFSNFKDKNGEYWIKDEFVFSEDGNYAQSLEGYSPIVRDVREKSLMRLYLEQFESDPLSLFVNSDLSIKEGVFGFLFITFGMFILIFMLQIMSIRVKEEVLGKLTLKEKVSTILMNYGVVMISLIFTILLPWSLYVFGSVYVGNMSMLFMYCLTVYWVIPICASLYFLETDNPRFVMNSPCDE